LTGPLFAAVQRHELESAAGILTAEVNAKRVHAATLYVSQADSVFARSFGAASSVDDVFLLASITKPISVAALMTLYDLGKFQLDDQVRRFIPEFTGQGRDAVTIRQLLTHTCGLPDQLPENQGLRARHAELSEFVRGAIRTPLLFEPGTQYRYASMGILLAAEIAQRITGRDFREFVDDVILRPWQLKHAALGLGRIELEKTMRCQVEDAAPESGAGDPTAKAWDWNSRYWRELGSPWGGAHASAPDVARFLAEFLHPSGMALRQEMARLMVQNHNPQGVKPRGLGFDIGASVGSPGCSEKTFGHGGSTGTLAWADPSTGTICVVLTTLPSGATKPHPRQLVSDRVAKAMG
jgi:CubicO group peptidase (beta-lactamase class C family)